MPHRSYLYPRIFFNFTITGKMLLGYAALAALSLGVVLYVLFSLYRLNSLNNEIVNGYIPTHQISDKMLDALVAQDMYEKRSLILRRKDVRALFWQRADEFRNLLSRLRKMPDRDPIQLKKVAKLHARYNDLFVTEIGLLKQGDFIGAKTLSNGDMKRAVEELTEMLAAISSEAKDAQDAAMSKMTEMGSRAYYTTMYLCLLGIIFGTILGKVITKQIFAPLQKLHAATGEIAKGNFHYDPGVNSRDEIGDLARAFTDMGKRLKKLEEMYLDASPLTRLPGGVAVENVMNRRLAAKILTAFCVLDLDNFKVYNDSYGYAHGNVVIKETARILESAVKAKGCSDDFVGHIDGDDFVVITTPEQAEAVCSEIIRLFDAASPQFYAAKDREKGFIIGKNRQGEVMEFPLLSISIAVVTNQHRTFVNTLEASTLAAELKDHAKTIPKSVFLIDKRHKK